MQVAILSARTGWHTDELCRALAVRGHVGCVVPYERLIASLGRRPDAGQESSASPWTPKSTLTSERLSLLDADAVLARIIPGGSLEQVIFRVDALHWLEERGVAVINSPKAIERSVDKFYTDALLAQAGLPTPETVVCEGVDDAMAAVMTMGDVVIKPIFGSMGHGLVRVDDADAALRVVRALAQIRAVFYVQRALDHRGRDVRAFVVGGRLLGAIERTAAPDDWRSNVSRGATARAYDLPDAWAAMAVSAAAAIGADYAGVDLLPSADGSVFILEVNGIPGWQGLQAATGLDVAGAIVDHLVLRTASPVSAPETTG